MKLIAVGSHYGAEEVFSPIFDSFRLFLTNHGMKEEITEDTVMLFGGGTDIFAGIYNEEPHRLNQVADTRRDQMEMAAFQMGREVGARMLGICRGAQLLCALAGGKLVQNVTGHSSGHEIMTNTGEIYRTSSVHHQMMFPFKVKHKMLAWSREPLSDFYDLNNKTKLTELPVEPEIVYFPAIKGLAIQGHPEFMRHKNDPFVKLSQNLVKEYLFK